MSDKDKMWVVSMDWRIGIADSYRCKIKRQVSGCGLRNKMQNAKKM